jgi:hypothetical protein
MVVCQFEPVIPAVRLAFRLDCAPVTAMPVGQPACSVYYHVQGHPCRFGGGGGLGDASLNATLLLWGICKEFRLLAC